jgi:hypothetical protein
MGRHLADADADGRRVHETLTIPKSCHERSHAQASFCRIRVPSPPKRRTRTLRIPRDYDLSVESTLLLLNEKI